MGLSIEHEFVHYLGDVIVMINDTITLSMGINSVCNKMKPLHMKNEVKK